MRRTVVFPIGAKGTNEAAPVERAEILVRRNSKDISVILEMH
jgi:hypothetical protein